MKVLYLISGGDTGGARTHVHMLLHHLNQSMTADLVCFMDGPFAQDAAALGVRVTVLKKNPISALGKLRAMVRDGGYDLIHCHGSRGNLMGALLKPLVDVPVITTVHSDPKLDYMGRTAARLTYGTLNAAALRHMDYYVGVTAAMGDLLVARGFPKERIFTIYNGVEFPAPPAGPDYDRTRYLASLGLEVQPGDLVVGIAARLHPVKDLPTALRGFAGAFQDFPNLRLLIAGDGQDREALEALARELGIGDAVCFAGWVDQMPDFYRAIDINILTSLSETFPYVLTEGGRERLPTVASRVGGVPHLISHGENGLLFDAGDAGALAAHLSALAASAELREKLGGALYETVRTEFSAEATTRRQREIYETVLSQSGRRGVLICGAYGMHNLGDDAVLSALVAEVRSIDPALPITVLSRRPQETARDYGVRALHMFNVPGFLRTMRKSRLYINGGGSLIQDVTSTRSLMYYLATLSMARRRGCKVMMYGCGIGPVDRPANRRRAARTIDRCVDAITLRGERSLAELRAFGVTRPEIFLAADPALFLEGASPQQVDAAMDALGLARDGRYFGLCVRIWPGMEKKAPLFAAAADYAYETYGLQPVLLSVNGDQDEAVTEQVRALIHAPCTVVNGQTPLPVMVGLIRRMHCLMSMRLHPLIFAASRAVPLAAVSYDPKVASFLEDLGQSNVADFNSLTGPAELCALVDAAARADRAALEASPARLRALESRNVETARRLLRPWEREEA